MSHFLRTLLQVPNGARDSLGLLDAPSRRHGRRCGSLAYFPYAAIYTLRTTVFERYAEPSRRVPFAWRYRAAQTRSPKIENEPLRTPRMSILRNTTCLLAAVLALSLPGRAADMPSSAAVAQAEAIYADLADAYGVISTIDSGLFATYQGKDRAAWESVYGEKRKQLAEKLGKIHAPVSPRLMPGRSM